MQFSLLHIIYKCFLDSEASCRGRSGALLGVLRGDGPVWRQAFVGLVGAPPGVRLCCGPDDTVRCVGHCSALHRSSQRAASGLAAHCVRQAVRLWCRSSWLRWGCRGRLPASLGTAASAALSLLSPPVGREKRVRQNTLVCVLAHSWYVVNPCGGRAERQDRGAPVPRWRAGSPLAGALLLVKQDYAAVIFAVEIDFYAAVHEELAGEGIALPVVFAAVCVHLAKGVACVGIEAGKHEAGA